LGRLSTNIFFLLTALLASDLLVAQESREFNAGIDAYEDGNYLRASNYFDMDSNSAALYMKGLSQYKLENYQDASGIFQDLLTKYPRTRYKDRSLVLLENIEKWLSIESRPSGDPPFKIGVLLPDYEQVVPFTRSILTGLRLAIDEHNALYPSKAVQLLFEASGNEAGSMSRSMTRLAQKKVNLVVGPLFSEQAILAGQVAERLKLPLIVPLATDDDVSEGKTYVFQINPSYSARGQSMARHSVQRLRNKRFGVLYQEGTLAAKMASSFVIAARKLGAQVRFITPLKNFRDWYQLDDIIEPDSLTKINSIYIPVTGEGAALASKMAYSSVRRLQPELRILGNGEWHGAPDESWGRVKKVIYTQDTVQDSLVASSNFYSQYRAILNTNPDQPGVTGYNVGSFLSSVFQDFENGEMITSEIRSKGAWEGIGRKINLSSSNANQALYFLDLVGVDPNEGQ